MKALFLDRDGTLINEPKDGYVNSLEKLKIRPHVIKSLQKLQSKRYGFIMISNQPGLGTDKFPYEKFIVPQDKLMSIFKENNILFEKTYFCPHSREDNCNCRKPKTGLIESFIITNDIDFKKSYAIGDRESDILLAKNIGCKGILYSDKPHPRSDFNSNNWNSIVEYILNED